MRHVVFLWLISLILWGCNNKNEIYNNNRNNSQNISHLVQEIPIEDPIISGHNRIMLISEYLIVSDFKSSDKQIHFFNKNDFKYITSIASLGLGPTEVSGLGHICYDCEGNNILVPDHGQLRVLSYNIDSILNNSDYIPKVITKLNKGSFPDRFFQIENSYIGTIINPQGNSGFIQTIGEWDIKSGKIKKMEYEHPDINKSRVSLAVSQEHKVYATCQHLYDLITLCDYNGNLKLNIYGPQWEKKIKDGKNQIHYWNDIEFLKDKIAASYSGRAYYDENYWATSIVIFDLSGKYVKTLEIGYNLMDFCYDEQNNRIIMALDDEIQFAYINLDDLVY